MHQQRPVLGVDFDDVCVEFMLPLFRYHNQHYGTNYQYEDLVTFELEKLFKCEMDEKLRRILEFYQSLDHESLVPIPGAREAIDTLRRSYDLCMITARPLRIQLQTEKLIDAHFGGVFRELHFTDHYFTAPSERISKAQLCKKVGAVAFIDDAFHNASSIADGGIPVYMFDKPWNRGKEHPGVTRVFNWPEILTHLARERTR